MKSKDVMMCGEKKYLLSSAGGSGIPVLEILKCPMRIKHAWDGWRSKFPFYFANGSIIHKTAFLPYTNNELPSRMPEIAKTAIENVLYSGKYNNQNPKTLEYEEVDVEMTDLDIMYGAGIAEKQMEVWSERMYDPGDVEYCETKIVSDIKNPDTGIVDDHLRDFGIAGRIDLGLKMNGTRKLRDLKTCKSPLSSDKIKEFGYQIQAGTQRYLLTQAHEKEINDVAFFQLVKNKTRKGIETHAHEVPVVGSSMLTFMTVYERYKLAAEILQRCIKTGEFPKISDCSDRYGNPCKYYCLCYKEQFANPNLEIAKTLYQIPGNEVK